MSKRTDIHRPSAINPQEYEFVAAMTIRDSEFSMLDIERERFCEHRKMTGGKYSDHDHGGNCHVCGAHCIDYAIFYHPKTNVYIQTGFDCADKLEIGDSRLFRNFRIARKAADELKSGKLKAKKTLEDLGIPEAWFIYEKVSGELPEKYASVSRDWFYVVDIVKDMVRNLVKYGSFSEKQEKFIISLVNKYRNLDKIAEEREKERDAAEDAPSGRQTVKGKVLAIKESYGAYGPTIRWTVKDERGFVVNSTIPSKVVFNVERGDRVKFEVNLEPKFDDPKFAFGKRPTKAEIINAK